MMKNMSNCPKHGMYPSRFDSCPQCGPTQSAPAPRLSVAEMVNRMTDIQVRYIFQSEWWEGGTQATRQLCLAEYDKRIGLENWPAHISKEA